MNVRTLILGGIGAALLLVGVIIFTSGGDDGAPDSPASAEDVGPGTEPAPGAVAPMDPADTNEGDPDRGRAGGAGDGAATDAPSPSSTDREESAGRDGSATGSGGAPANGAAPDRTVSDDPAEQGAAAGAGVQDPSVARILRATSDRYDGVRALRADFEQRLRNALLGTTLTSRGTLYQRAPDRFLMRFSDPDGDVIVSDGDYFWLYFPSTDPGQVLRTRRGAQGLDLQAQFIGDPVQRFEATYHGQESVRGRVAHAITLTPRRPLGYRTLKVWIDDRDHLVRRFELTEDNGTVRHFELTDLEVNPSLPDGLFEFTPPAGAQVIDRG